MLDISIALCYKFQMYTIYQRQTLVKLHAWSNARHSQVPRRGGSTSPSAHQVVKKNISKSLSQPFWNSP